MVSDASAEVAAEYSKRVLERKGLEFLNEGLRKTKNDNIVNKIKDRIYCPECEQGLFYNNQEEKFFCPVCSDE